MRKIGFKIRAFRILLVAFFLLNIITEKCFSQQQIQWAFNAINKNKFAGSHTGKYLKKDKRGNIYVVGIHNGFGDYDPSQSTAEIGEEGSDDLFVSKYDSTGNFIFAFSLGGCTLDPLYAFTIDDSGSVYVSGAYRGYDLDPSPSNTVTFSPNLASTNLSYIVRYDSLGNYQWAKTFADIVPQCLATDLNGHLLVAGKFTGIVDFDPGPGIVSANGPGGNFYPFIAEYDLQGNYIHHVNFGNGWPLNFTSMKLNGTGKIYLTGNFQSTIDFDPSAATSNLASSGGTDAFIACYTISGNYLFARKMGGAGDDGGQSLDLGTNGKVYACGYFSGTADMDGSAAVANVNAVGAKDIFITGYDTLGNYSFGKGFGGSGDDLVNDISVNGLNRIFITGTFLTSADFDPSASAYYIMANGSFDNNLFTAGYDPAGNFIFAKSFGGSQLDCGYGITCVGNSSFIITGEFYGSVDFDPGTATQLLHGPFQNVCLAKYDASGNYIFAKEMGCSHGQQAFDEGYDIVTDPTGNIYVCGEFKDTTDFDPGPAVYNLIQSGNLSNMFVAKYSANGAFLFAFSIGNVTGHASANAVKLDASGNIIVVGDFIGTIDFNPSAAVNNLISTSGSDDVFFAKYTSSGAFISTHTLFATNAAENAMDCYMDNSGAIYVASGCPTCADLIFAKFTSAGTLVFQKTVQNLFPVCIYAIRANAAGEIYITGNFQSQCDFDPSATVHNLISNGTSLFLAKYDSIGNYIYAYACDGNMSQNSKEMELDNNGNIYISGIFYGTADMDFSSGVTNLTTSTYYESVFLAKYSPSAQLKFAFAFGGTPEAPDVYDLTIPNGDKVYLTGIFGDTIDFDPSPAVSNLGVWYYRNAFIATYDTSGNFISVENPAKSDNDPVILSIDVNNTGEILTTGYISYTTDVDPTPATYNLRSDNGADFFLAKYTDCQQSSLNVSSTIINSCYALNNGSVILNASSNTALSYEWMPSGGNSPTASNLAPGNYTCVVTNLCGLSDTVYATISSDPQLFVSESLNNLSCNGGTDGSAMLSISGGIPAYQYDWSTSLGSGPSLVNAPAGNYSCTITDAANCQLTAMVTLTEPVGLSAEFVNTNPVSCVTPDGMISLSVSSAIPGYSYLWNTGSTDTLISGLNSGIYSCTVTDQNNCVSVFTDTLVSSIVYPVVTLNLSPDFLCSGTSAISLSGESPAGGTWSGPFINNGIFDPNASGTGTFSVSYSYTDSLGCTVAKTDTMFVDACLALENNRDNENISVYPNPASNEISIISADAGYLIVLNSLGQPVFDSKISIGKTKITTADFADGLYTLEIITDRDQVFRDLLIISHN
jgi:hypothetical protein